LKPSFYWQRVGIQGGEGVWDSFFKKENIDRTTTYDEAGPLTSNKFECS